MAKNGKSHGCGMDDFITKMGPVTDKPSNAKTSYDSPAFSKPKSAGGPPLKIMDTAPGEKAGHIQTTMQPLKGQK